MGSAPARSPPTSASIGVTLAIGDTEPVTIALDKRLPAGPWNARVTLHSGLLQNSARATITFPETAAPRSPYLAIVLLVVLLLLGIAAMLGVLRRRRT